MIIDETCIYKSPVGLLRISQHAEAICEVSFIKAGDQPVNDITAGTGNIPLSRILRDCMEQLDRYFNGTLTTFDLKLQQQGTEFQQKVWRELMNIRFGKTTSYLALSKNLGDVKAIRAVGTANGKNNIAIIVPCHRVIGSNGDLVGYAGELWRKKWLLGHEAKFASGVQTLF